MGAMAAHRNPEGTGRSAFVPAFAQKYEMSRLALWKQGKVLPSQKSFAFSVFPDPPWKESSAKAILSSCKHGEHDFPASQLALLLKAIDPDGALECIPFSAWLGELSAFRDAMVAHGLIDAHDCEPRALSERLCEIRDTSELLLVLREFPRTCDTNNIFGAALQRMSAQAKGRFEEHLHRLINDSWQVKRHTTAVRLAAAILARMATRSITHYSLRPLLESNRIWLDPGLVRLVEPLCFLGVHHGDDDLFVRNIISIIEDKERRAVEYRVQVSYYGTPLEAAEAINSHLRTRSSFVGAHDVGRAISLYPELLRDPNTLDLAGCLKGGTLMSLKEVGVGTALLRQAEKLMPSRLHFLAEKPQLAGP
jgi:hypothetical protein